MVSLNRQGHIVATLPKDGGYGKFRNMTPRHSPAQHLHRASESTPCDGLSYTRRLRR
ncbi:hypothetical protein FA95DRAFT_1552173 [Auriscalpium vulgare]|uniref:Uncharacterized protein n=1 Tax=Auriscalpium vulgare TaxID=40419 RepID=A0ACB8SCP6_9AGAM|nr:hypothetical protein FA95DRAFT_1552173 [Auriscalpium vulgare]